MDQEGHALANKRSKMEENEFTQDSIVQSVDDTTVDKSICSPVVDLIDDAWLIVFSYLGIEDRTRIARVCRRWRELARISWRSITKLSFENIFKQIRDNNQLKNRILEGILPKCGTRLQSLNLSVHAPYSFRHHCTFRISSRALELVGLYCTSLQELNLSEVRYLKRLYKSELKTLAERLPKLRSLNLKDCGLLEEEGLRSALQMLQSLTSLNVGGYHGSAGEFFSQAPQSLTEVSAEHCWWLSDDGVRLLAERCPNLETIDISCCHRLTVQSIIALTTNCPKLKRFKSNYLCWDDFFQTSDFLPLSNLPLLEELHVDRHTAAVTDEVFHQLGTHCPLLRSISCKGCYRLTDASLAHLSPCLHLESIDFSYCLITDDGLIKFSSAPSHSDLKKVHMTKCHSITDEGVGHLLLAHPNLLELNIEECDNVTDRVLHMLESNLQRRQHTQPLEICLKHTSVSREKAEVFRENTKYSLSI